MSHLHDVAIIGAGPGGSAAAHYLARQGLDVLLLDKADFPRDKTCGDGLTPRALHVLEDMGILAEAQAAGFRANGLELHAKSGAVMTARIPNHPEYPNYLLIVPRLKLDDIIRRRALESGARFESPVRVRGLVSRPDAVEIQAEQGGRSIGYRARVVILAIGANMRLLQEIGLLKRTPSPILAARAYYENIQGLNEFIQVHFSNVPIPGYGWVFPTSSTSANIGVGFWPSRIAKKNGPSSARHALVDFIKNPDIQRLIKSGSQVGNIKSYPLRTDFTSAKTYSQRLLLIGETIGLVSPLTGEGIDFAMQSGFLAARFLIDRFSDNDFSVKAFAKYDAMLRQDFQKLFRSLDLINRLFFNPAMLDKALSAANADKTVKTALMDAMLAMGSPRKAYSLPVIAKIIIN